MLILVHYSWINKLYIRSKRKKNITKHINRVGCCTVDSLLIHCGLWQCCDENGLDDQACCVFFLGLFSVFVFFFQLSAFIQCIDASDPRKRQNSAQGRGLRRFFTPSVHSAQTKKALGNDKTLHSKRGHGRPFPLGFFVDLGWVRGALVISLFF